MTGKNPSKNEECDRDSKILFTCRLSAGPLIFELLMNFYFIFPSMIH